MAGKLDFSNLDTIIREQMSVWQVPGTAVAVIQGDDVRYMGTFGSRDIKNDLPVTKETIFAIGSASKAFTSLAAGILVEDGTLDWDKPVKKYIPGFGMCDPFAEERLTVRDMLCHRTGLPRHEFMWYNASFSRKEIFERLRYLEPNKDFRSEWQYNNQMFASVGYLLEAVSGQSWEEIVQRKIFDPLDMRNSNFSVEDSRRSKDFSLPYSIINGQAGEVGFRNIDIIGPAGSINSNLVDMVEWLKLQLNMGSTGKERIVSRATIEQMHTQHMACKLYPWTFPEIQASAYGLAWFIDIFRGRKLVHHGGNIDGFSSLVGFLPEENIGVVLLSNLNRNFLNIALLYTIVDMLLGIEDGNWCDRLKSEVDKLEEQAAEQVEAVRWGEAAAKTREPDAMHRYAGTYEHPGYGTIEVSVKNDDLHLFFNNFDFVLRQVKKDTFSFFYEVTGQAFPARFIFDGKESAGSIAVPFEETVKDIVFKRI